jgi:hypothetical protein
VEEHVAQVEPGLDVVGIAGGDRVVERLRVAHLTLEPGALGVEQQAVVLGEPVPAVMGPLDHLPGKGGHGAPGRGGSQMIVGQGEVGVFRGGALQQLHGVEVAPCPETALTLQVSLERRQRAGHPAGQPSQPPGGSGAQHLQHFAGELVHQSEELGLSRALRLHAGSRSAGRPVQLGCEPEVSAALHHRAEQAESSAELRGQLAGLLHRQLAGPPLGYGRQNRTRIHHPELGHPIERGGEQMDHPFTEVAEGGRSPDRERQHQQRAGIGGSSPRDD